VPDLTADPAPSGVVYLVTYYPTVSHTFIRREIEAVRAAGVRVETVSVRRPANDDIRSAADRRESASTRYILGGSKSEIVRAHRKLALRHPSAYLRGLAAALRTGAPQLRSRAWQLFYFAEAVRLVEIMRDEELRHVHVHFSNNAADIARLAVTMGTAIDPTKPWAWSFSVHGPTEFSNVDKVDLAAKVRSAEFVACITDFARSQLMAIVDPSHWSKMHVVHMGVDLERYPSRAAERLERGKNRSDGSDGLHVLFVGRLVPEKGVLLMLDVAEQLRAHPGVEIVMVGAGPMHDELERQIKRRGLGSVVRLVGAVGQDDLPDWYGWADVFCLPSFNEGLPVVLMEALLTEAAVVTTAIAGIPELVRTGDTGIVVPAGRADLVADAIEALIADPDRRRALGAAGRRAVVADFDAAAAGRRIAELHAGLA
jgi:colanic acid/amylovoran biosynthesis glycosyltransferase